MSDYLPSDVELEADLERECSCETRRLLEQARSVAVGLEAELAALRALLRDFLTAAGLSFPPSWQAEYDAIVHFITHGSLPDINDGPEERDPARNLAVKFEQELAYVRYLLEESTLMAAPSQNQADYDLKDWLFADGAS